MTEKWNNLTEKAGSFLFLCLYANRCEPEVHSYQLYIVQSTSSPILKFLGLWGHFGQLGGTLYKSVTVLFLYVFIFVFRGIKRENFIHILKQYCFVKMKG